MKIAHTADWHIGQLFHEYDRSYEHRQFLSWLVQTLQDEQVDVLLISGDVFDLSNPSAASVRMCYTFLNGATRANPGANHHDRREPRFRIPPGSAENKVVKTGI